MVAFSHVLSVIVFYVVHNFVPWGWSIKPVQIYLACGLQYGCRERRRYSGSVHQYRCTRLVVSGLQCGVQVHELGCVWAR